MQSKQSKQCLFRGLSKKIVGGNVFLASVALCSDDIEIAWEERESVCSSSEYRKIPNQISCMVK
jgi:hypothetical protein